MSRRCVFGAAGNGKSSAPDLFSVLRVFLRCLRSRFSQKLSEECRSSTLWEVITDAAFSCSLSAVVSDDISGEKMNHHQLEKDIEHLEQVMVRISAQDRIPLSYWRNRIESFANEPLVPAQAERVKRLDHALRALEAAGLR
jgi:hypothetical protein